MSLKYVTIGFPSCQLLVVLLHGGHTQTSISLLYDLEGSRPISILALLILGN